MIGTYTFMGMFYGSMGYTTSGRKKKVIRKKHSTFKIGTTSQSSTGGFRRETPDYPSVADTTGVAARRDSPQYTGTLVKGIGTLHKSNAVPIIDEQHMKDIARMRR